jgi:hypothetical protein
MTHAPFVQQVLASEWAESFEAARAEGRALSRGAAIDLALDGRTGADR